jgi:hypothetical protein
MAALLFILVMLPTSAKFAIDVRDRYIVSDKLAKLISQSERGDAFVFCDEQLRSLNRQELRAAVKLVQLQPDASSYHLLLVLREGYPMSYARVPAAVKAAILCTALAKVRNLNDWGTLAPEGVCDDFAAEALVETGTAALAYLRPLLDDPRPALLGGSEEATMSIFERYRRADYSSRYACLILGMSPEYDADPTKRDAQIEKLKVRLDGLLQKSKGAEEGREGR